MEADVETDLKRNYGEEMRTQVFIIMITSKYL